MDTKDIVTQIVSQLTPYIVTGIVALVGTITTTVANMFHRTASNAKVIAAVNAIAPTTTQTPPTPPPQK